MDIKRALKRDNDSFKKIIIVKDHIKPRRDEQGIVTMGIMYFLPDEHSLEAWGCRTKDKKSELRQPLFLIIG